MKYSIGHSAYYVADMKASLYFYVEQLGLEHSFSIQDNEGKPWIEYLKVGNGQFIELFYGGEGNQGSCSYAHLCLQVADIHACADELEQKGVLIDTLPIQGKDLNWQCWVHDPDGNPIEFMQIHPESPQAKA